MVNAPIEVVLQLHDRFGNEVEQGGVRVDAKVFGSKASDAQITSASANKPKRAAIALRTRARAQLQLQLAAECDLLCHTCVPVSRLLPCCNILSDGLPCGWW